MERLFIGIFDEKEWPISREEAEKRAAEDGADTLLCIFEDGTFCGRSPWGVWCAGIPEELNRIINFLYYEKRHGRRVHIWAEDIQRAQRVLHKIEANPIECKLQFSDEDYLCHSTTITGFEGIIRDGQILSYSEINKAKINVKTLRFDLKEPEDHLEYVDFCSWEGIASEIVVASREFGEIRCESGMRYKPGIRIYFSPVELKNLQGACSDGLHTFRVHKKVSIEHAKMFVFASNEIFERYSKDEEIPKEIRNRFYYLEGPEIWTPEEYVKRANELVRKNMK